MWDLLETGNSQQGGGFSVFQIKHYLLWLQLAPKADFD